VAHGQDPASQKAAERGTPTVSELADQFLAEHVKAKRKSRTADFYRDILDRWCLPAMAARPANAYQPRWHPVRAWNAFLSSAKSVLLWRGQIQGDILPGEQPPFLERVLFEAVQHNRSMDHQNHHPEPKRPLTNWTAVR
jgi:hypothetical protein